jgi:hypothetical protein
MSEEVSVRHAERQRIRGTVRESADGNPRRIDRALLERLVQRSVDELDVRTPCAAYHIPGEVAGIGRHYDHAEFVRHREGVRHAASAVPGAVQHHHQRRRDFRIVSFRDVEKAVAIAVESERALAWRDARGGRTGPGLHAWAAGRRRPREAA